MKKVKAIFQDIPFINNNYLLMREKIYIVKRYHEISRDLKKYNEIDISPRFVHCKKKDMFCYFDSTNQTPFDHHYLYHPAWAARIISKEQPAFHIDISSSLYFCTLVSAFVPFKFYDYRPAKLYLSNLSSHHVDITSLPFEDNSVSSLSCMHTVEHIGLGRYGDSLDPDGDLKAINELSRVIESLHQVEVYIL